MGNLCSSSANTIEQKKKKKKKKAEPEPRVNKKKEKEKKLKVQNPLGTAEESDVPNQDGSGSTRRLSTYEPNQLPSRSALKNKDPCNTSQRRESDTQSKSSQGANNADRALTLKQQKPFGSLHRLIKETEPEDPVKPASPIEKEKKKKKADTKRKNEAEKIEKKKKKHKELPDETGNLQNRQMTVSPLQEAVTKTSLGRLNHSTSTDKTSEKTNSTGLSCRKASNSTVSTQCSSKFRARPVEDVTFPEEPGAANLAPDPSMSDTIPTMDIKSTPPMDIKSTPPMRTPPDPAESLIGDLSNSISIDSFGAKTQSKRPPMTPLQRINSKSSLGGSRKTSSSTPKPRQPDTAPSPPPQFFGRDQRNSTCSAQSGTGPQTPTTRLTASKLARIDEWLGSCEISEPSTQPSLPSVSSLYGFQ